ncbi:MAG: adenylosuccinate lyase [Rhodospirillaceae bacterium]|nr:adenylosuccinate lyase [Rhodospirillaceae bacterium]
MFSDQNRVQKWLDVEAALAEAQAELGIIPTEAAREIVAKAIVKNVDIAEIGRQISQTAHPIVPAVRALEAACDGGAGEFVHYGATTQDIIDTGMMLQVKEAWPLIIRDLTAIRTACAELAHTHKSSVMAGRTHGQQALPITLGYKCAVWVDEIDRHLERIVSAAPRVLSGNITGAVGTMASFGDQGRKMQRLALDKLGLDTPIICWHSARDRVLELANLMVQIACTLGKLAREVYALQQVEFGEIAEPHHHGKVGSSTMPHKRNPAVSELAIGLSRLIRAQHTAITDAVFQEHERYSAMLRIELAAVPEIMVYTGALLAKMRLVLENLEVDTERMRTNLDLLGGLLLSERVMLALGEHIGKQTAHEVVYEIAMASFERGETFRDALLADLRVAAHLDKNRIDNLLDPSGYVGLAETIVEDVLAKA